MSAETTDIEIVQGATFTMSITWTDGATPPTAQPLNGYYAHMQIRLKAGAPGNPLIDLSSLPIAGSSEPPAITLEPDNEQGVVSVRISALDTSKLTKNCVYDLFLIKEDDPTQSVRLVGGNVTIDRSVTVNR